MIERINIRTLPKTGYGVALEVARKVNEIILLLNVEDELAQTALQVAEELKNGEQKTQTLEEVEQSLEDKQDGMEEPLHADLVGWRKQEPPHRLGCLSKEPKGYRDLIWCPYGNEPAVLEYVDGKPYCPNCLNNFEAMTHGFIAHIKEPK